MSLLAKVFNQHDKIAHFSVGVIVYAMLHFVHPVIGLLCVALVAFGKEIYDHVHRDKHTPEWLDVVATMAGGLVAFVSGL
jgi:hypothetical protein